MRNTDIRIRDPYIVADKETKQYFYLVRRIRIRGMEKEKDSRSIAARIWKNGWRKDMHSDHRKTFGQIRTFGHRRCISILENGI